MYNYIIVDDEPLIRMGTIKKLAPLAGQICCIGEADNGKQALLLLEAHTVDFVILDMQMPIMDGTQLLPFLSEAYPSMPLIVISGYKNFDYVKYAIAANAIDYILKPFSDEQIIEIVQRTIAKLEDSACAHAMLISSETEREQACLEYDIRLLQNLVLGYATEDVHFSSKRLSFITHANRYCLVLVYTPATQEHNSIQEHLAEMGLSDLIFYISHPGNPTLGFYLLCMPGTQHSDRLMKSFQEYICSYSCISYWGISEVFSSVSKLHNAYKQSCTALNTMPVTQKSTQYFEWTPVLGIALNEFYWSKKEEFLFRIESGETSEVARLLRELQDAYTSTEKTLSLADTKYYYYQLTEDCLLILKQYIKHPTASESMQTIVNEMFSFEELAAYYERFYQNLTELLKPQSIYAHASVIEQIQLYTQRNYYKNLTVDFLASLFYMNSSYLSHMYRKNTGEKYVDFLNRTRIAKAKELLLSSNRKLYQIARAIGYDNDKYFIRVFKKHVGITPEQFRR